MSRVLVYDTVQHTLSGGTGKFEPCVRTHSYIPLPQWWPIQWLLWVRWSEIGAVPYRTVYTVPQLGNRWRYILVSSYGGNHDRSRAMAPVSPAVQDPGVDCLAYCDVPPAYCGSMMGLDSNLVSRLTQLDQLHVKMSSSKQPVVTRFQRKRLIDRRCRWVSSAQQTSVFPTLFSCSPFFVCFFFTFSCPQSECDAVVASPVN